MRDREHLKHLTWQQVNDLFWQAKQGDRESTEKIFSFLRSRSLGIANRRLKDGAEDVVQEVMIVVHNHLSEIGAVESLIAFCNQVLRNKIGNIYQSAARKRFTDLDDAKEYRGSLDKDLEGGEMQRIVRKSIDMLGEKRPYCRSILLCLFYGLEAVEISDKLGIPKSQLKTQTFRCRGALRDILKTRYGLQY